MIFRLVVAALIACATYGSEYHDPHCIGNRHTMVQLFEWTWRDIAFECEDFLGPYGYCGVQVSPPSETRIVDGRPWWEKYQPVSYILDNRAGNETEFRDMVERCNAAGVRIYVDAVINHMTQSGSSGVGTAGSPFNAGTKQFPAVPYGPGDFNGRDRCHSYDGGIHNINNKEEAKNCELVGLVDLALGNTYVREKVADFMSHLVEIGVAGFRIDAAMHMWPGDMKIIFDMIKDVPWGGRPFIVTEVLDWRNGQAIKGEDFLGLGKITNFMVGTELASVFRKHNPMKYLHNWGTGWNMWHGLDVVNFIDNHDNQRRNPDSVMSFKDSRNYKLASAFMLAHPYGMPRVMSSYEFNYNDQGPPSDEHGNILPVEHHDGMLCGNGWVCEHRWREIHNMVAFRNIAAYTEVENWWSGADYQIAFSRGNKAFIALNREEFYIDLWLQTGLPGGEYCDVISGNLVNGTCTGSTIHVNDDGSAHIVVCNDCEDPMIAIHVGAKVGDEERRM